MCFCCLILHYCLPSNSLRYFNLFFPPDFATILSDISGTVRLECARCTNNFKLPEIHHLLRGSFPRFEFVQFSYHPIRLRGLLLTTFDWTKVRGICSSVTGRQNLIVLAGDSHCFWFFSALSFSDKMTVPIHIIRLFDWSLCHSPRL